MSTSVFFPTTSKSLTSTPLKVIDRRVYRSKSLEYDSDTEESTYSLLSPIYHDSFEHEGSDDELEVGHLNKGLGDVKVSGDCVGHGILKREGNHRKVAEVKFDKTSLRNLGAWEQWLVIKAKEDRLKSEQKALEERTLLEKKEQEEREKLQKKLEAEGKIQEWLKTKKQLDKEEKGRKEREKQEEEERERQKAKELERRAEERFKQWLLKKKQEEHERKEREKEEAALKQAELRERARKAEETFQQWLKEQNKNRPKRNASPGYDNLNYPSPSFCNPIPWKPIHNPPPERPRRARRTPGRKQQPGGPPRLHSTPSLTFRSRDTLSFASKRR
ncbi:coiled-coil domain-containing protein 34 isoform X2 [Engraulis encrasicolus]|uniref:coiled-coil domain-containing protein 34 isoform X2 n=1 Tax=Engraulis encrasicolus TaxID=184585 RepID=UPI002FD131D9